MDEKALARQVAIELGPDVVSAIENPVSPSDATRAFGLSEAMLIGSFLTGCAQLAVQVWQARQDRALLILALAEGLDGRTELASQLDPEQKLGILARIVNAIVPERFGSSPSISTEVPRSRKEWLVDWAGYDGNNRAMTQPVLVPFADMDNWIVYRPIHWTPPAGAPDNLPTSVSVPTGFVSDFATIPPYFWWALPPTGRYGHAALLHDWLYWEQRCSRAVADRVFEVALGELNVDARLRKALWAAVRVGGGPYWREATTDKRLKKSRVLKRIPDTPVSWADWQTNPDVFA